MIVEERHASVVLRALEPEDLDFLYTIENDREMWDVGTTNVPYSRFALNNYILGCSNDIFTDKQLRLMVQDTQSRKIGLVDVFNFEPLHHRAEIGIAIIKECRGRGYGHEALRETLLHCRNYIHIHQLSAFIDINNKRSLELFKSLGFNTVTILKDWLFDGNHYHDAVFLQKFL